LRLLFIAFFGEIFLTLWLLIRGWKLQVSNRDPEPTSTPSE
jgi:hypothetical protein